MRAWQIGLRSKRFHSRSTVPTISLSPTLKLMVTNKTTTMKILPCRIIITPVQMAPLAVSLVLLQHRRVCTIEATARDFFSCYFLLYLVGLGDKMYGVLGFYRTTWAHAVYQLCSRLLPSYKTRGYRLELGMP